MQLPGGVDWLAFVTLITPPACNPFRYAAMRNFSSTAPPFNGGVNLGIGETTVGPPLSRFLP
jgi:hypothetical protein